MKKGIHPASRQVAFRDRAGEHVFVMTSTLTSEQSIEIDGHRYPLVEVDVSSASHPFWTGRGRVVDTEGRVEAFERRYGRRP
ncbi:MAG: type B 50S ribosomal protein L31 [Actinobacteria bacterium]|uniref:Unannotated protein n=1 Tax=freshwater metagenome TaxID=449393 RepID=A0A6J6R5E6_9ZZZZ|nr:type B 50S ribosomal protein L31 [Actinomycetota bacterium]